MRMRTLQFLIGGAPQTLFFAFEDPGDNINFDSI